jgi:hypothetical protein
MVSIVVAVGPWKDQHAKLHSLKNIIRSETENPTADHADETDENERIKLEIFIASAGKKSVPIRVIRVRLRLETRVFAL